jgi:hypothetical protein
MDSRADQREALERELNRIGLAIETIPGGGLASGPGGLGTLIAHVQSLPVGSTWHDVFPDLPKHWKAGRPETWTKPYKPRGPWDYQELPTGPLVWINWEMGGTGLLTDLLARARAAGFKVYGAGMVAEPSGNWKTFDANVVLERTCSEDELEEFMAWVQMQPDMNLAAVPRTGSETYLV